ncbi:3-hydroxyisobutyryl-CoA hydrolase (enoyl-CoA hydratase/isomerase) [Phlyctema vagabunda]|uniref:3-hydroxyisobutyryl-CoA hydrolase n=1 Tax=Phlyctema vagabunda TaxID=108571 RepID=A0ABR4PJK9_9HELO
MFTRSICSRAAPAVRWSSSHATMPLRAKVTNPTFTGKPQMSTSSSPAPDSKQDKTTEEHQHDAPEDVLFNTLYGLRSIELNRPKKLHSLNGSMIRKITPRLQEWAKSGMANVIVIKGSGPKAFCAGGDVLSLAKDNLTGEEGQQRSADYFASEYKLDYLIATYKRPYVAFLDGITMGGGVGLSIHAPFRIATERTLFAMPETTIGFFPDVGASFFLPRMNGAVGTYLALTSERLKGVNAFYAGIATHYIHSTSLPALESRLAELRFKDYHTISERNELINATIEEYTTGLPHDEPMLISGELRNAIDRCFGQDNVPAIIQALQAEVGSTKAWAEETLATLEKRSPISVHVTLRQMRLGRGWNIKETFQREHQIAAKFMRHQDFTEGVHALLVRKDSPKWKPTSLKDIKPDDKTIDSFFTIDGEMLQLEGTAEFVTYPHLRFGIPREADVKEFVEKGAKSQKAVVEHFVQERAGKQGVEVIVKEIVQRRTRKEDGVLVWLPDLAFAGATPRAEAEPTAA